MKSSELFILVAIGVAIYYYAKPYKASEDNTGLPPGANADTPGQVGPVIGRRRMRLINNPIA